ncbi:putative Tigger transposable element-derived protein 1-like 260 [Homarus americanus]|uniref:Putative Tigger transposable element-derived protein 1-like 260 n=1 Tax=Homarus americanus TaxID=6706 RepID=A0A8J5N739_HOMAM|nr:putative Tigger transposable element-derived protein 1-like 260 [Homarus americanus]
MGLARQAGFDELESEDIENILVSHTEELTNQDLQQLTEHSPVEDDDDEEPQQTLTSKRLAESLNMFQTISIPVCKLRQSQVTFLDPVPKSQQQC